MYHRCSSQTHLELIEVNVYTADCNWQVYHVLSVSHRCGCCCNHHCEGILSLISENYVWRLFVAFEVPWPSPTVRAQVGVSNCLYLQSVLLAIVSLMLYCYLHFLRVPILCSWPWQCGCCLSFSQGGITPECWVTRWTIWLLWFTL